MPDTGISELVRMWVDGWVISRGSSDPVGESWGWTIDVGQPRHVARHVLPVPSEADVRELVAVTSAPGTWLKLFAEEQAVLPWVGQGWRRDGPGFLMSCDLAPEWYEVPAGYTLTGWRRGGVSRVLVRTRAGHFAARGQMAHAGAHVVVDQVETAVGHRRKGLGGLVMRTLQSAAREAGARTGLLVGTPGGRALYSSLGWTMRSPVTSLWYEPSGAAQ